MTRRHKHSPELSVVILAGQRRRRAARGLASVLGQDFSGLIEVVLLDLGPDGTPPVEGSQAPSVQVATLPRSAATFGEARAAAVRRAKGRLVAFLEEHCIALPGWAAALVEAHKRGWKAIGPEIQNGNPQSQISQALAMVFWAPWLAPIGSGEMDLLPGHNSAYDREVLMGLDPLLDRLMQIDLVLQRKFRQLGHGLYLESGAKVAHLNESSFRDAMGSYYHWNRLFGAARSNVLGWSGVRRLGWALATPLVPWIRLGRMLRNKARGAGHLDNSMLHLLPLMFAAHAVAACGHAVGLLVGEGGSHEAFLRYELHQYREPGPLWLENRSISESPMG